MDMQDKLIYPDGAKFAFTILDDTDDTTLANGRPVYDLLKEAGMRTTKTVWAFDTEPENRGPYFAGETLSNPHYLEWVHELFRDGFEIAFHNATMGSSLREDTIRALDYIEKEFGKAVRLHCNHGRNRENIYWGAERYSSYILSKMMHIISRHNSTPIFDGHLPGSPYYWSDIAAQRLSYMRAFAYRRLNGRHIFPGRPFIDSLKLQTPILFNTADAPNVNAFNKLVNPESLEKLHQQGGWAIVSTHFGKGFCRNNKLNEDFEKTIRYLADIPGWYVPVSRLLDHLVSNQGASEIGSLERFKMESSHVIDRLASRFA